MKEMAKRTAVAGLAGVMAVSVLAGCGEKNLDGTKTVATVNGTEVPLGVVSLYARQQQAQTEALYLSLMGDSMAIWDTEVEEGVTYGQQLVDQCLESVELMYIMKEKAGDFGVEVTEEDQSAIGEAAAAFIEENTEETLEALGVSEEQVKTLLELETYYTRMRDPIVADVDTEIPEDEVQQAGFTYVSINTSSEDLTEEDKETRKEQAQEILDKMLADPEADMDETAKEVSEDYSALSGNFAFNESDNEEVGESTYAEEVITALRGLEDGEVYDSVIETDTGYYIVRLDTQYDEEATESKKESIISARESDLYTETTDGWLEEADITTDEKVLETLVVTDSHGFTIQSAETEETEAADETSETADETADAAEEDADADETEAETETDAAAEEETVTEDAAETESAEAEASDAEEETGTETDSGSDTAEEAETSADGTEAEDTAADTADAE